MGKGRKQVIGRDLRKRLAACLLLSFTFAVFLVAEATKPKAPPAAAAMPAPPKKAPEPPAEPKPSEWHLGLSANLQLVTVNLTTRTTQAGFSPGLAFGAMWQPPWWTLSDSFLGIDALVDAKFVDLNNDATFDYFRIDALPIVTLIGMVTAGIGVSYNLALNTTSKDTIEYIFTFGLSTPVGLGSGRQGQ